MKGYILKSTLTKNSYFTGFRNLGIFKVAVDEKGKKNAKVFKTKKEIKEYFKNLENHLLYYKQIEVNN